jgi:putative endonuclease
MVDKTEIGRKGENVAADFLVKQGFEIAARNYRHGRGEIDLIVKRDDWLLFIEVKTRSSTSFGEPEGFLHDFQMNRIFDAAENYIFATDWQGNVRFDVISIKLGKELVIDHFEDAIN